MIDRDATCPGRTRRTLPGRAPGPRTGVVAALAAALVAALLPASAGAGNRSTYLIGGRAAAMGGAYTAFGDEGAAAWYNPAALSLVDRHSFDLSASAYGFEMIRVPRMVSTTFGQETTDSSFDSSALAIVPTSLDAIFRLSEPDAAVRHVLAFSVLVPNQRSISQTFEFSQDAIAYSQKFRIDDQQTRYYIGPSYGAWLNENVSVGGSLFVVYDQITSAASIYLHQDIVAPDGTPQDWFVLLDESFDGMAVGLTAAAAVHLRFGGFRLGLQARLPVFRVYSSFDVTNIEAGVLSAPVAGTATSEFVDRDRAESSWDFEQITPAAVSLGLGWDVPRSWRVGVDVTWRSSLAYDNAVDYRHTVDVAVGAEVWLTDTLPLTFGFFTDFAPEERLESFGDRQMDYFGGAVAITMVSPYHVVESEKTDRITFATTIGLHYAYGSGTARGLTFDLDRGFEPTEPDRDATGHDVHLFVASTVRF